MTTPPFISSNREPSADGKRWEPMSTAFGPYLIIDEGLSDGTNFLSEYTISAKEGLTAVDTSLAVAIVPQSAMAIVTALFFILRLWSNMAVGQFENKWLAIFKDTDNQSSHETPRA